MSQDKVGAYKTSPRGQESERQIEARALLTCAGQMRSAIDAGDKDLTAYAEAIRLNQQLWTIFQVSLCDPENPLPKDLKVLLLNLSRYVDKTSFRAISEFAPELLTSMIDINRSIATGLSKNPEVGNMPAPAVGALPVAPAPTSVMTSA